MVRLIRIGTNRAYFTVSISPYQNSYLDYQAMGGDRFTSCTRSHAQIQGFKGRRQKLRTEKEAHAPKMPVAWQLIPHDRNRTPDPMTPDTPDTPALSDSDRAAISKFIGIDLDANTAFCALRDLAEDSRQTSARLKALEKHREQLRLPYHRTGHNPPSYGVDLAHHNRALAYEAQRQTDAHTRDELRTDRAIAVQRMRLSLLAQKENALRDQANAHGATRASLRTYLIEERILSNED